MKLVAKIILIIIVAGGLIGFLTFLAYLNTNNNLDGNFDKPLGSLEEADWKTAVEILNTGRVTEVMQSHTLEVILTVENGSQIKTIEPAIDDIFREVELCGKICQGIVLITE